MSQLNLVRHLSDILHRGKNIYRLLGNTICIPFVLKKKQSSYS